MRSIVTLVLVVVISGCAYWPAEPLTDLELQSIASAEAFVLRHGYTEAGHPDELPVEQAEVLDFLFSPEELVRTRIGSVREKAFGIVRAGPPDTYYVLFERLPAATDFSEESGDMVNPQAVLIEEGVAVQYVHSTMRIRVGEWKASGN